MQGPCWCQNLEEVQACHALSKAAVSIRKEADQKSTARKFTVRLCSSAQRCEAIGAEQQGDVVGSARRRRVGWQTARRMRRS